jgi:fanconi anemia group M protein
VLEIDKVCALKAASSSAPAPAPVQQPPPPRRPEPSATAGGGGRQLTLDRFIRPCASVQQDREMLAPAPAPAPAPVATPAGGSGHPGARTGEGCSRQAGKNGLEDRFMESFSLRREEKAAPAPVATPAGGSGHPGARVGEGCSQQAGKNGLEDRFMESFSLRREEKAVQAPVPAPAGGRERPQVRAGKGCSRPVVEEVSYDPCAVALDYEAVQTWIYPSEDSLSCCIFLLGHHLLWLHISCLTCNCAICSVWIP